MFECHRRHLAIRPWQGGGLSVRVLVWTVLVGVAVTRGVSGLPVTGVRKAPLNAPIKVSSQVLFFMCMMPRDPHTHVRIPPCYCAARAAFPLAMAINHPLSNRESLCVWRD
jgi:hypothetical protein